MLKEQFVSSNMNKKQVSSLVVLFNIVKQILKKEQLTHFLNVYILRTLSLLEIKADYY